jgi:hypothetical protein
VTEMSPIGNDPASTADERRSDDRVVSVLINAGVAQGGRSALCRIRNLSEAGMMIETRMPLAVDEEIAVQLRSGLCVAGTVRWTKDHRAGIALHDTGAELILIDHGQTDISGEAGVFPRFKRNVAVFLTANHRRSRCSLTEVSLGDAILACPCDVTTGQIVTIAIEGLEERLAEVVHIKDDCVRVIFTQPLHFKMLEQWLEVASYQ